MDQQQQGGQRERPLWPPTREQVLWTVGIVAILAVAVLIGYRYDITLWDWIKLLVVPAVIAGGGFWFNTQQREREQRIANNRAQDEALQAYLDHMSGMLIPPNKDLPSLYKARPGDSLSNVARARTLTGLPRLDGPRKVRVVQFLYESGLISQSRPVLDLHGANLEDANLGGACYATGPTGQTLTLVTGEELEQQAESLEGATMPNGQKYEDWLNTKDRELDGRNDGSS